jgi:tetratricopeptide (TPR) repeat protein
VELEPNRADHHLELGMLQFESGRVDEAIASFQQAKKDPKKMRDAAFWLGRSFLEKGRHNLAVNQLESAFEAGSVLDLRGKETLYFLGAAKRAAGDLEGAKAHFERIYEEDIHFRDVARILEEWA